MGTLLLALAIRDHHDVGRAQARVRQLAGLLTIEPQARQQLVMEATQAFWDCLDRDQGGRVEFFSEGVPANVLIVRVSSADALPCEELAAPAAGAMPARRTSDRVSVSTGADQSVRISLHLPERAPLQHVDLADLQKALALA